MAGAGARIYGACALLAKMSLVKIIILAYPPPFGNTRPPGLGKRGLPVAIFTSGFLHPIAEPSLAAPQWCFKPPAPPSLAGRSPLRGSFLAMPPAPLESPARPSLAGRSPLRGSFLAMPPAPLESPARPSLAGRSPLRGSPT